MSSAFVLCNLLQKWVCYASPKFWKFLPECTVGLFLAGCLWRLRLKVQLRLRSPSCSFCDKSMFSLHLLDDVGRLMLIGSSMQSVACVKHVIQVAHFLHAEWRGWKKTVWSKFPERCIFQWCTASTYNSKVNRYIIQHLSRCAFLHCNTANTPSDRKLIHCSHCTQL